MRNQRILFAIHEKDRFKWFLKRRHYFQSRVQCSIPYCPHHPKGLFVPVKFPGRLGRTVFLCEASHAHCDGCYYKLKSSWISYISNTAVERRNVSYVGRFWIVYGFGKRIPIIWGVWQNSRIIQQLHYMMNTTLIINWFEALSLFCWKKFFIWYYFLNFRWMKYLKI